MLLTLILVCSALVSVGGCLLGGCFESLAWLWVLPLSFVGAFLFWLLAAVLFLLAAVLVLKKDATYEHDSPFYRTMTNLYIELIITLVGLEIETEGLEKRPTEGRFLLVSNHLHEIDPGVLMHYFPKAQLGFIAKREVRDMFLVGKLLPRLMGQMLNRESDREALKTILTCIRLLKEDEASIAVFPEGGINEQRKFKHLKPGVFKIAQKAKVPIVVCTLRDTQHVLANLLKLRRSKVTLHVLEVIEPQWMEGKTTVEIADHVYGIMAADLGPENLYVEENT